MRLLWGFVSLLALSIPAAPALAQFVNVATGNLAFTGTTFGVAWGDYDRDGDPDLYITNGGAPNRLFRNDNGSLVLATPAVLADAPPCYGAAWGDYDNDQDLDLYVARSGGNRLFRNDQGTFVNVATGAAEDGADTEGVSWTDFDGDGDLDLHLVNFDEEDHLLRNDNLTFIDVTPLELSEEGEGHSATWGDFDGDGDPDVYLAQAEGSKLFRNDWPGGFRIMNDPDLDLIGGTGVEWGDYDNDGLIDLYVGRDVVTNQLIHNLGNENFTALQSSAVNDDWPTQGVAWADVENDGDLDLWVGHSSSVNRLYRNDGNDLFVNIAPTAMANAGSARGAAWADYDRDGDLDLYVAIASGANKLFRNDLASNNKWLHVDLVGNVSNRSAIGARLTAWAAGVRQTREVQAGYGLYSMGSFTAEFGFGNLVTQVDSLVIDWPSGIVDRWAGHPVNVRVTLEEGATTVGIRDPGLPAGFALLAATPNPFRLSTRIAYEIGMESPLTLRVFDVSGALVRVLASEVAAPAGRFEVSWDGRADSGRRVAPGVYLYRLDAAGAHEQRKITVLTP